MSSGRMVTATTVQKAVEAAGIDFFQTVMCTTCKTPLGFEFGAETPMYRSACKCKLFDNPPRPMDWNSLADYFFMRRERWNELQRLVEEKEG